MQDNILLINLVYYFKGLFIYSKVQSLPFYVNMLKKF